MKIENAKIGDIVFEDYKDTRLKHEVIGFDSEGRAITKCLGEIGIIPDTTVETMIEAIKEKPVEKKPVEKKPAPKKAPAKKTTKKK